MGPILFLYYEECLVSTNLNSKLFWFHSIRPNLHGLTSNNLYYVLSDLWKASRSAQVKEKIKNLIW